MVRVGGRQPTRLSRAVPAKEGVSLARLEPQFGVAEDLGPLCLCFALAPCFALPWCGGRGGLDGDVQALDIQLHHRESRNGQRVDGKSGKRRKGLTSR